MAEKRIYRRLFAEDGTTLIGIMDELTTTNIPLDPNNADYALYLELGSNALLLNKGESLPPGVTGAALRPPPTFVTSPPPGYPPEP